MLYSYATTDGVDGFARAGWGDGCRDREMTEQVTWSSRADEGGRSTSRTPRSRAGPTTPTSLPPRLGSPAWRSSGPCAQSSPAIFGSAPRQHLPRPFLPRTDLRLLGAAATVIVRSRPIPPSRSRRSPVPPQNSVNMRAAGTIPEGRGTHSEGVLRRGVLIDAVYRLAVHRVAAQHDRGHHLPVAAAPRAAAAAVEGLLRAAPRRRDPRDRHTTHSARPDFQPVRWILRARAEAQLRPHRDRLSPRRRMQVRKRSKVCVMGGDGGKRRCSGP